VKKAEIRIRIDEAKRARRYTSHSIDCERGQCVSGGDQRCDRRLQERRIEHLRKR